MDSKKFDVRSFRGCYETDDIQDAITQGKKMILDIITDGFGKLSWHVMIFDNENDSLIGFIQCNRLGWWRISINSKYDNVCQR